MSSIRAFGRLLRQAPPGQTLGLLALMVLVSWTEGMGLLLLVPLLETLGAGAASQPGMLQSVLARLQVDGLALGAGGLLLLFMLLVALRSAVQLARDRLSAHLQHGVVDQLRLRCFNALLTVEWRWLVHTRRADHASLLLSDVSRVGNGLHFGLALLASSVTTLTYLLTAWVLSWSFTLVALAGGAVVFVLLRGQHQKALQLGQNLTGGNRALHGNVQESLAGIKLAKILGTESRHLADFTLTTEQLRQQQLQFVHSTSQSRAWFQLGGAAFLALYLYLGLTVWHTPVPVLLILVLIFSRLIPLLMAGHQQFHYWLHALPALQETERLLADCQASAEPIDSRAPQAWPIKQSIGVSQLTVQYETRDQPALANLSLQFLARTTTAIMGPSGAGKSTLADVLMGLLSPDSGTLTVDGEPITGPARHAWRKHVAYVPQEVFLFNDTIRRNLRWGQPEASDAELLQALQRAAADFVLLLPNGMDAMVGDGGVQLSGGERQRLALARALLKRPSLLILDEATSALDVDNEARVRLAIEQLHGDLTIVIIGHRLPTLEHADQVVVLEAGRVSAQGTWAEVRAQQGLNR